MPRPVNKLTQMQHAREYYLSIARRVNALEAELRELDDVLGAAQNGPPEGAADGSIIETTWNELSNPVRTGRAFCWAIRKTEGI